MARKNKKTKNKREAGAKMGKNNVKEMPSKTTTTTVRPDRKQMGKVKTEAPKNVLNDPQRRKQQFAYGNRNINSNQKPQNSQTNLNTPKTSRRSNQQNPANKNVPNFLKSQSPPKKPGPSTQQNPVIRNGPSQNRKSVQSQGKLKPTPPSQVKPNGSRAGGSSTKRPTPEGTAYRNLGDILKTTHNQPSHQAKTLIDPKETYIKAITNNPNVDTLLNSTTGEPITTTTTLDIAENLKRIILNNQQSVIVAVVLVFLMGCICIAWRWLKRLFPCRWKFGRKRKQISEGSDRTRDEEERQRLLSITVPPIYPDRNIFGDVLTSLTESSIVDNNEPQREWSKTLEDDLKEFEESLKIQTETDVEENTRRNEKLRKLQEEIKKIESNIAKMKEDDESPSYSLFGVFGETDRRQEEFQRQLDEQNRIFEEQLKKMREERAKKEKAAEEELNRMRYETQQSIAAFLACIQLRLRFEEKEDEWSTSLKRLRQPLISLKNSYYDLQNEMKYFDPNDEFSNLQSECRFFAKKIEDAQNMLIVAFDNLDQMSKDFADRIFIRMIMKACSEQGVICHSIGVTLVEFLKSKNPTIHMKVLDRVVSRLDPHSIPTTDTLKRNAPFATNSDYIEIRKIPQPEEWLRYMN
ncbi:hypothetical protein B9Z55_016790 [Caenorhabditis nigoni]|nr:hypothetical protein B9Z55_016790 [Caenorhabditis nigoni]